MLGIKTRAAGSRIKYANYCSTLPQKNCPNFLFRELTQGRQVGHHRLGSCPADTQRRVGVALGRRRRLNQRPALELSRQRRSVLPRRQRIRAGNRTRRPGDVRVGRRQGHGDDGEGDEVAGLPDKAYNLLVAGLTHVFGVDLEKWLKIKSLRQHGV